MEKKWESTSLAYTMMGDSYPEGKKIRKFSNAAESPTEEQLGRFGDAIAKLGLGDTAMMVELTTKKRMAL